MFEGLTHHQASMPKVAICVCCFCGLFPPTQLRQLLSCALPCGLLNLHSGLGPSPSEGPPKTRGPCSSTLACLASRPSPRPPARSRPQTQLGSVGLVSLSHSCRDSSRPCAADCLLSHASVLRFSCVARRLAANYCLGLQANTRLTSSLQFLTSKHQSIARQH